MARRQEPIPGNRISGGGIHLYLAGCRLPHHPHTRWKEVRCRSGWDLFVRVSGFPCQAGNILFVVLNMDNLNKCWEEHEFSFSVKFPLYFCLLLGYILVVFYV